MKWAQEQFHSNKNFMVVKIEKTYYAVSEEAFEDYAKRYRKVYMPFLSLVVFFFYMCF